jgi:hypothetical protein
LYGGVSGVWSGSGSNYSTCRIVLWCFNTSDHGRFVVAVINVVVTVIQYCKLGSVVVVVVVVVVVGVVLAVVEAVEVVGGPTNSCNLVPGCGFCDPL